MDPITAGLILGGGLGLGNYASQRGQQERDKGINAAKARYAPFTGERTQPETKANLFGDLLGGGLTGLAVGQGAPKLLSALGLTAAPAAVGAGAAAGAGAGGAAGMGALELDNPMLYEEAAPASISPWDAADKLFS